MELLNEKQNNGTITIEKYDNANPPKFIPPHNAHGDFKLKVDAKTVDTVNNRWTT